MNAPDDRQQDAASSPTLDILLDDDSFLVVAKPSGLSTQAPPGIDSLETRVRSWLVERAGGVAVGAGGAAIYLGVPHRLDRPVSGAVLFAKTPRAARKLSRQFEQRRVRKLYWACVEGRASPASGDWNDYVRKVPNEPRAEIVAAGDADARLAVLHYTTLGVTQHGSWLLIELETGRMHQVRLQAASRGLPLLGDALYGSQVPFGKPTSDPRERAIALHARSIEFRDPDTQANVIVEAPVPASWSELGLTES